MSYQPRYAAYARAHGKTPEQMAGHDEEQWPGGCMCGFILWIGDRWREWRKLKGYSHNWILSEADHVEFDAWLTYEDTRQAA